MSDRPGRSISSKDVKYSKTIKDFNASPLQSSKSLPKVNKKISKKISGLEIGDNYITDKLRMAEDTLVRMERSKVLWGELIRFFDKMHTGLKLIAASSASIDETLLSLSKLHFGELGETLADLAQTRARISQQYQICAMTIFNSFVLDVAHSMDPHLKKLESKSKEVHKDGAALKTQMATAEKNMYKQKKNQNSQLMLQDQIKQFNTIKQENDRGKAMILSSVLLFEKERMSFLVSALSKVAMQEIHLGEKVLSQNERLENWKNFVSNKSLTGAHAEAVAVTRTLRSLSRSQMERQERLKQSKKTVDGAQPNTPETSSNPRASVFGEKFSTMKERNQNRETLTLGTNRQTMVIAKEDEPKPDENEPEVIATCEDILHDMRECALNIEDALLNLDGKVSNDLIDEINNIFALDELKKAENLIWEYEDYTVDYPTIFHGKKYWNKKQFFKRSFENMKEKLNQLLEEELQLMQQEFSIEKNNITMDQTY